MYKKLLFIFSVVLLLAGNAIAKTHNITATGIGSSRDLAILNALENAVQQFNGVSISKDTPTTVITLKNTVDLAAKANEGKKDTSINITAKNSNQIIQEQINAKYQGKVHSYQIIKDKQLDTGYEVIITAQFITPDDYKQGPLANKKEYSIALPLFFSKQKVLCQGQDTMLFLDNATFDTKEALSNTRHFKILDRQLFAAYSEELSLISAGLTQKDEIKRLKNIIPGDYLLIGSIRSFSFEQKQENIDLIGEIQTQTTGTLNMDFSLVETATMENIFSTRSTQSLKRENGDLNCQIAFNILSGQVAKDIASQLSNRLLAPKKAKKASRKMAKRLPSVNNIEPQKDEQERPIIKLPFDK